MTNMYNVYNMTNRQLRYRMNHYIVTVKDDDQSAS